MSVVGIFGYGYVGKAVEVAFFNHATVVHDPAYPILHTVSDVVEAAEIIFICVPTPSGKDGIDASAVFEALGYFDKDKDRDKKLFVVKSTILPRIYREIKVRYGDLHIVVHPEFLRSNCWRLDAVNPPIRVIGSESANDADRLMGLYHDSVFGGVHSPVVHVTPEEACVVKYFANVFLATKVALANDMQEFCAKQGIEWEAVQAALCRDPRIGETHLGVPGPDGKFGYGGACFPKDIAALMHEAQKQGTSIEVLLGVSKANLHHRNRT